MTTHSAASIRFKTDSSTHYVSGAYIHHDNGEFILSICPELATKVQAQSQGELSVALPSSVSTTSVVWDEIELVSTIDLPGSASFFRNFNGFERLPQESPKLSIFKFRYKSAARAGLLKPLEIHVDRTDIVGSSVRITSCPFGGVNPALFIGYESSAVVSFLSNDNQAMLLDTRFLDNMEGGIITTDSGKSLGLVYGMIIKSGGEGRLTTAIPWSPILEAIKQKPLVPSLTNAVVDTPLCASCLGGVVVVHASLRGGRRVWGSGVLIEPDVVVTNKHVVGNDYLSIEIWFDNGSKIYVHAVSEPINGVDLVLLRLSRASNVPVVPLAAAAPETGSRVTSQGFGLVYPGNMGSVQPLVSKGIIATKYIGPVYDGQPDTDCSMLISTAGCWNGSSGGGLLNESGEIVGIMASNARDEHTGEIMPDMAFVIPVNILHTAVKSVRNGTKLNSTTQFQRLWNLQQTHADTKRPKSKL